MKSFIITTNNIANVCAINKYIVENHLQIDFKHGKYLVDATSLLGCLSMDFTDGVEVICHDYLKLYDFLKFLENLGVDYKIYERN